MAPTDIYTPITGDKRIVRWEQPAMAGAVQRSFRSVAQTAPQASDHPVRSLGQDDKGENGDKRSVKTDPHGGTDHYVCCADIQAGYARNTSVVIRGVNYYFTIFYRT